VGTQWGGVATYCIAVLETKVKILDVELQIRKNELGARRVSTASRKGRAAQYFFSDLLPYNARHLVAIEFDDRILHYDLLS
jgi:hypothetical protein